MARGIAKGAGGTPLMSFHPRGAAIPAPGGQYRDIQRALVRLLHGIVPVVPIVVFALRVKPAPGVTIPCPLDKGTVFPPR